MRCLRSERKTHLCHPLLPSWFETPVRVILRSRAKHGVSKEAKGLLTMRPKLYGRDKPGHDE